MKFSQCSYRLMLIICLTLMGQDFAFAQQYDTSQFDAMQYRLVGPFRGGRSAAVTGVPGKPNLFYFGATGGGIWKTLDGGRHWHNISDGFFGGSVGAIKVAESDPNVIYVGGGEQTVRGNVSSGFGLWKSVNAGKTWSFMGLEKSRHIPRIVTDHNNADVVYAAVLGDLYKPTSERGVYKSTDGGKSWRKTLFANENAGATDLIIDPNNPRILYASTWNVRRTPYSLSSGGPGSALWKSTDYGETWTEISTQPGFPEGTLGIIGITVSPQNSERLWAMVEHKEKGGVYRSDDGGAHWTLINSDRSLRQRAWYYTRIFADTQDENTVYVLNVRYHKSTDGGKTFAASNAPHGDHHDLWIAPENPKRMIMGDDGGAQVTYDGGDTWSTYHNQPTAQFYRVTTDDAFPYRIYAAQQDNSTIRIQHRAESGALTEDHWESTAGGESAHIAVDPLDNDIVYGGSYDGFLTRYNHKKNTVRSVSVWPDNPMGHGAEDFKYRFQWNFPIFFSPHNPKKMYAASNHLHATTNEGASWDLISPDLTRNDPTKLGSSGGPITQDNTSVEYYCTIFAAAESPMQEGLIYTGSDDGLLHVTTDGGAHWTNVTPKNWPEWMMINSITPSTHDAGTCYVAGTRYKSGDYTPYLYKTKDFGQTWQRITDGIPAEHFTRVIREDLTQQGLLYAGTEAGLYVSFDDGDQWQSFQLNLPIVPITDLALKNEDLIVATQGRSLWMIDDLSVLRQLAAASKQKNYLFKPKDTYRLEGRSRANSTLSGTNHPNGVMVYYTLNDPKNEQVSMHFIDQKNDTIKSFYSDAKKDPLPTKKGHNLLVWDLQGSGAERLDGMILWWASTEAPKVVPGTYQVRMRVGDQEQTQTFVLHPDANAETDLAGMQQQYDFIESVNQTVDKAHKSIAKIRRINSQLKAFNQQYQGQESVADLVENAAALSASLTAIEEALYQTQNKSGQDPLNFPIKLTNKLAHLNSLVGMDDFPPTAQDVLVKDELTAKINTELTTLDELIATEIKAFNETFNTLDLQYLIVD